MSQNDQNTTQYPLCKTCQGSGGITCFACEGRGVFKTVSYGFTTSTKPCEACHGSGIKRACQECEGKGYSTTTNISTSPPLS